MDNLEEFIVLPTMLNVEQCFMLKCKVSDWQLIFSTSYALGSGGWGFELFHSLNI